MASRQNPISFKTVPNRNKTQKWQQAKTYNYDGDDWGGYDPYDEYAYDDPPMPPLPPQQQQQPPPVPQQFSQSQSFGRPPIRQNSFDQGDERRNFSAGPVMYGADGRPSGSPARSNVSGGDSNSDGRPRSRPRDFTNPEQVPPPLAMRGSPGPAGFPPRKSSISSGSPAPDATPAPAIRKEEKELPIPPVIRPSDIYKRMEAEREKERQSMEGSRPSPDTLQKELDAPPSGAKPLSSVQEDFGEPIAKAANAPPPTLPAMRDMSGIGTSFLHGSSEADQQTRAPDGKDPAAEILAERAETRAPPGNDPAAEILAERTTTRAQPGADPAADIMAERGHTSSIPEPESGVENYRSMVDQAFDNDSAQNSASLSRDSSVYSQSLGGTGVSRNNSSSTAGISPIMSRVPSAATAKMQQIERDRQVPTIAEEPSQRPTPNHSRNVSAGSSELVQPGYRRSLDPPSGDNSPARTPGLENAHSRRLSQPMSAETSTAQAPDVADQGVEMMPALEPGETPASEAPTPAPLPTQGRSRAGTDYSMRESDMARQLSTSPAQNEFSPSIAQAATAEQTAFLEEHASTPTSQWPPAPTSGRSSPNKGRVREIAGKYQTIEAESRRGSTASSKSSWSNFGGSNENLPGLKKRATGESGLGSEVGQAASETRPQVTSQMSFRPGLPGQWVSYAPTPSETPAPIAEQPASMGDGEKATAQSTEREETPDFSPTTDKHQPPGHSPSSSQQQGFLTQAKDIGEALGASVMSKVGVGHQTRDFASTEPPAPVEQPRSHKPTGEMGQLNAPDRPELYRGDTEGSMATDIASSASSVPPTPPVKDDVGTQHGQAPRQRQLQEESRPISNYFSTAVAPLQPSKGHSREASANLDLPKLGPMTNLSTATREDDMESDRLRREIVRSLSPTTSREDDAALTQDALDAPDNMRKVEGGQAPEPAAESTERPGLGLLNQRFSWEERPQNKGVLDSSPAAARTRDMPTVREPEPEPEIMPEMPYERPRSRNLHIMNAEGDDSSDDDKPMQQTPQKTLAPESVGIVSPFTPSQENLRDGLDSREISRDNMSTDAPSPGPVAGGLEVVDSKDSDGGARVPSYYMQGQPDNLNLPKSPSLTQQSPIPEPASPSSPQTAIPAEPSASTSPTTATGATNTAADSRPRGATTTTGKIPPFREILANKDTSKRMKMYKDTRQTFADTHTGLSDWLEGMLERNPEYAQLGTRLQPSATSLGKSPTSGIGGMGHKHSPSLAKFKQLGSSFAGGDGSGSGPGIRRTSTTRDAASASAGGSGAPPPPPKDAVWEQRGKDLMKGAGVLGGKAQAGAKGLLMKGRSRFGTKRESGSAGGGSEKALPPTPPTPPTASSTVPAPRDVFFPSTTSSNPASSNTPSSTSTPPPPRLSSRAPTGTDSLLIPSSSASVSVSASASASSSAAPSRAPSQAPRDRTPSTLSRTWSRLRERRSRSKGSLAASGGGGSRSQSRPASVVINNMYMTASEGSSSVGAEIVHGESDAHGALERGGDPAGGDWNAPWDEPDESEGEAAAGVKAERLGVLPSPTATAFSVTEGWSPTKGGGRSRQGSHVEETIREEGVVREASVPVPAEEKNDADGDVYEELQRGWGTDSEADAQSVVVERPALGRGESDRAFLPSQLKGSSAPQSPRSPTGPRGVAREEEEDLYESTPRQMHFPRTVAGDEGEEAQGTPVVASSGFDHGQRGVEEASEVVVPPAREDSAFDLAGLRDTDTQESMSMRPGGEQSTHVAEALDATNGPAAVEGAGLGVSPPSPPAKDWDKRSAVSSEDDNFHDAKEMNETDVSNATTHSRRSSVSSLGMTAQAVPAGPMDDGEARDTLQQQPANFMERSYRSPEAERPMSYMPMGTTAAGVPVQEELNRPDPPDSRAPVDLSGMSGSPAREPTDGSAPAQDTSVDLSGISGPPVGMQPYQQHPAMRRDSPGGGLPGDHGGLRSPPPAPDASAVAPPVRPALYNRQVSADTKSSKRMSGFFRSRRPSQADAAATTTKVYGPAPSTISDQYGLENLATSPSAVARPDVQAPGEAQQAKRRSGIWSSFKRNSVVLADDSRQSSVAGLPSQADSPNVFEESPRQTSLPGVNTLKKPQRATTNATPPDPTKKKRFSGIGSLFGRSSTTGHKSERPRKLTKQPTAASRDSSATYMPPSTSSVATGYEAFEEARRREARQTRGLRSPHIGPPQQERADLTTAAIQFPHGQGYTTTPPADGWYAPGREEQEQQFRRLHSERTGIPLQNVPEAFRPVEASFAGRADPVGPAMPGRVASPPVGPGYQQSAPRPFSGGYYPSAYGAAPPQQRHMSYGSNEYRLSPQVSGQSEYQPRQDWAHRGSSPSVSPVHSRTGSEEVSAPRHVRMGSISQQMSRGEMPQQEYADQQQRPWAVSMPDDSRREVSQPIGAAYGGGTEDYLPYDDYNHTRGPYPPMQIPKQRTSGSGNSPPTTMQYGRGPYPSPPYSPPPPIPYQQGGPYPDSFHQASGPQHQRYYSLPAYSQGPPPGQAQHSRQYSGGQQQRPLTSEYVGRRDEPALGEENIGAQMRGSSYPGQEWAPGRWD